MNAPIWAAREDWPGQDTRPRLGVVDFNPIQYRTPLYQLMTRREGRTGCLVPDR